MKLNREYFMTIAGAGYVVSNVGLTFGAPLMKMAAGVSQSMEDAGADLSMTGAFMLGSSTAMMCGGTKAGGRLLTYALGTVGWVMLATDAQNVLQGVGAATGLGSSVYGTVRAAKEVKAPPVVQQFTENVADATKKYPYAVSGILGTFSALSLLAGSMQSHDTVMSGVAALWVACSALVGLSKSKAQTPLPQ